MSLAELALKTSYHKGRDDIGRAFYLPCMLRATHYDRAVGFFRSSVFVIAWPALRDFVRRGGRIRILCSQVLARADVDALEHGYSARADDVLRGRLVEEVKSLIRDPVLGQPARLLASMVASEVLDLQVAVLRESEEKGARGRIFHDKLGIFRDNFGEAVIFKGSMNETWTGLAIDGNLESVDVAGTWMGARDQERVRTERAYFEDLWAGKYPGLRVRPFPRIAKEELLASAVPDWESELEEMEMESTSKSTREPQSSLRSLRPHQAAGIADWKANGRQGILAFATGSGKTFAATTAIRDSIEELGAVVLVVVPDQVLFDQWLRELSQLPYPKPIRILRAGAGHSDWRDHLHMWTEAGDTARIVLATVQTAAGSEFKQRLAGGAHLMLVADEVHRLGAQNNRQLLDESRFGPRLGLSATPERAGDELGTQALLSFFRRVLEPRYELSDAIRDGVLTSYFYRPHPVHFTSEEQEHWDSISADIRRLQARLSVGQDEANLTERLKLMLIQRAKITKQAREKIPAAIEILSREYSDGHQWIVYCDDIAQVRRLIEQLARRGIDGIEFHSQMKGSRAASLEWFGDRGGVIVAVKCLDEGVDIPSVTHALIIASSKNPREFIQRRGRVLRRSPGKALAHIHDLIVVPQAVSRTAGGVDQSDIAWGELARAVHFAQSADNPAAAADLQQIAIEVGIDWQALEKGGFEDADD